MKPKTLSALTAVAAVAAATSLAACDQRSPGTASTTDTLSRSTDSMARTSPPAIAPAPADKMATPSASSTAVGKAAQPIDDAALMQQVKTALASEPALRSQSIDVDAMNGTVTLSGAVDSAASKTRANEVAAGVIGVASVVDRLTVKAS